MVIWRDTWGKGSSIILANNRIPLLAAAGALACLYFFFLGDSGILQRLSFLEEKRLLAERIELLEERQKVLRHAYDEYREGRYRHGDTVLAGFIGAGEKIIFLRDLPGRDRREIPGNAVSRRFVMELKHLRILWVFVSMTVLAFFFLKKKENKKG